MSRQSHKLYTVEQANQLIPILREKISELRTLGEALFKEQDRSDIEEITSMDEEGVISENNEKRIDKHRKTIAILEHKIDENMKIFENFGCELKSLDPGLVDFYSERNGKIVYLCWEESEDEIGFWHALEGGYDRRQAL